MVSRELHPIGNHSNRTSLLGRNVSDLRSCLPRARRQELVVQTVHQSVIRAFVRIVKPRTVSSGKSYSTFDWAVDARIVTSRNSKEWPFVQGQSTTLAYFCAPMCRLLNLPIPSTLPEALQARSKICELPHAIADPRLHAIAWS